jgi:hypothetical protein
MMPLDMVIIAQESGALANLLVEWKESVIEHPLVHLLLFWLFVSL